MRALHLPPSSGAEGKNGEFCALELEDGALGLSFVMLDDTLARLHRDEAGRQLAGPIRCASHGALAAPPGQASGSERSLALAALNALSRHFFERAGFVPPPSRDSIGQMDPQPGERIGMVGYFRPLARRIAEVGAELVVIELDPALAGQQEGYRVTLDAAELGDCARCCAPARCSSMAVSSECSRRHRAPAISR